MAILGRARGHCRRATPSTVAPAGIRTLVLPFSIALWFVALVEILIRSDRRALHDLRAGTCVVYHWQARGASLPWLHRDD